MRWFVLAGVIATAVGCGAASTDKPVAAPKSKPPVVTPAANPSPPPAATPAPVAADAFPNVAEAVKAFSLAVAESNSEQFAKAQSWLILQKATAIPAVADMVRDEQAPLVARTTGCKILAQLGPEAAAALLELSRIGTPRVRHVAIVQLGNVRPTSQQVIDSLIALTKGTDTEIRVSAIMGLIHVDPPAKDAADAMLAILNNTSEPESLRTAAKQCLTTVNPRKTFND